MLFQMVEMWWQESFNPRVLSRWMPNLKDHRPYFEGIMKGGPSGEHPKTWLFSGDLVIGIPYPWPIHGCRRYIFLQMYLIKIIPMYVNIPFVPWMVWDGKSPLNAPPFGSEYVFVFTFCHPHPRVTNPSDIEVGIHNPKKIYHGNLRGPPACHPHQ